MDATATGNGGGADPWAPADASLASFHVSDVRRGTIARLWLVAPDLPAPGRLAAIVVRGASNGPTVLVTCGIHGDEFEARVGLRQVVDALDVTRFAGTLLALPVCNPWAFAAGTRCTPAALDGHNLAREFPGSPDGTPTRRLAHHLRELVDRHLGPDDLLVDLHSGGTGYAYRSLAGFRDHNGPARSASEEAARHAGLECLWAIEPVHGTLTQYAAERGIPAVGTEFRGEGRAQRDQVDDAERAILGLLSHAGCIAHCPVARDGASPRRTRTLYATVAGFLTDMPDLRAAVREGQTLAQIRDELDEVLATVTAPVTGELWAVRTFPSIGAGDIVALVAHS